MRLCSFLFAKYFVLLAVFLYRKALSYEQIVEWAMNPDINGYQATAGIVNMNARSPMHCGIHCTGHSACASFFYTPGVSNGCQLVGNILSTNVGLPTSINSIYYVPKQDNYTLVRLSDQTIFRYRIGQQAVTHIEAEANCASDGGRLVEITTPAKLAFLQSNLTYSSTPVPKYCGNEASEMYMGKLEATVAGDICQRWDSQNPHPHNHNKITDFPETVLADAANYCRDPDYSGQYWCMTANPSVEWDWCTPRSCTSAFDTPTESCYISGSSTEYMGTWSVTKYGRTCQRWDAQAPHAHSYTSAAMFPDASVSAAANYCRDPNGSGFTWCFTNDVDVRWEPCYIRDCLQDIPERRCYNTTSHQDYTGTWNMTSSGFICQRWDIQAPHQHSFTGANFPDASISEAGNYCRDPDNSGYLWCLTSDPSARFESCDIPQCDPAAGYHIQGTNQNAQNIWSVTEGVAIESTSWAPGRPDYPNIEHCALLDSKYNWKLNDGNCDWKFWFICEK